MTPAWTLKAIAELCAVSERTVTDWIASGDLRSVNLSRSRTSGKPRRRVLPHDLDAFLASRASDANKPAPRRRRVALPPMEEFV
ncbi:MAG: helix-turn-helix domain-containing protein [Planctomycetaceae bacterium]